jgi:predicted transcriptional regulator
MSESPKYYPPDHDVFKGGRYLEALSCLEDIDHYELAILQYLGSKMPFDKGFIDRVAFPSVSTISHATKISESTVRKKIKSLVGKGYVKKRERRLMNERGHWQQSSNDYSLTSLAFEKYEDVIETRRQIACQRKRAVGESFVCPSGPCFEARPPLKAVEVGESDGDTGDHRQQETNSPANSPNEDPNESPYSYSERDEETRKQEVNRLVRDWEEVVKKPVSTFEKRRFQRDYIRIRSSEALILERIEKIKYDPYLLERAKSINWLLSGFEMALKNKLEIQKQGHRALETVKSPPELQELEGELPAFIQAQSMNFANPTQVIIDSLFGDSIKKAKARVGGTPPGNMAELNQAIETAIESNASEKNKQRLRDLKNMLPSMHFSAAHDLFLKYSEGAPA